MDHWYQWHVAKEAGVKTSRCVTLMPRALANTKASAQAKDKGGFLMCPEVFPFFVSCEVLRVTQEFRTCVVLVTTTGTRSFFSYFNSLPIKTLGG